MRMRYVNAARPGRRRLAVEIVNPIVLGTGKRLFGEGAIPRALRLVESQQTAAGAVLHVYERAGKLRYGEVEVGQETRVFD